MAEEAGIASVILAGLTSLETFGNRNYNVTMWFV